MSEAGKPSFEEDWSAWMAQLAVLSDRAETSEQRARIARVKQAGDGIDSLAVLCHDVKDPVASVLMGVTLLKKSSKGADTVVDTIANAARRLDRVVTGANDLSLLRRGEFQVRMRALPLASLVTTIVENQQIKAGKTRFALDVHDANVVGDSSATTRIVLELLDNAIAFSNDGDVIDVRVRIEGEHAVISVSDAGPGIDEAHLAHVFDETRNRAHRPRRGAGRGLPIAHALANLQNATLTIARRVPTGCEAKLRMQVAPRSETTHS